MKKIFLALSVIVCTIANSQTVWNYATGSCGDPYDYCLQVQADADPTQYPLLRLRDTSMCKLFTDTTYFSCLESGHNISRRTDNTSFAVVTVNTFGQFFRCNLDSIYLPYTHITGAPSVTFMLEGSKGSATVSGTLLQTAYTITHSLSYTPTSVFIQAKSSNASAPSWVSNITSTTFTVNFVSVPILGTNNISFNWIAYK